MQKDRLCRSTLRNRARGFTLVELILVIVILGVLAVFAAPRILNTDDFKARGFHDETLSLLRYAQKTAVAQRRSVCVNLNATGVTMTIFATNPATGTCPTPTALNPPNTPRGGTGLAGTPSAFQFTPLGSTDQSSNVTITITNAAGITVEAATGFVHD
jgi:MSHA pilin protein MshC